MTKSIARIRDKKFRRQAGLCFYCALPMWTGDPEPFAQQHGLTQAQARRLQCTAEHLLPRQDGGSDAAQNIVAACRHCNQLRHRGRNPAPTWRQYLNLVTRRVARKRWHHPVVFERGLCRGRSRAVPV